LHVYTGDIALALSQGQDYLQNGTVLYLNIYRRGWRACSRVTLGKWAGPHE